MQNELRTIDVSDNSYKGDMRQVFFSIIFKYWKISNFG
jgi:hypothetical protein